MFLFTLKEIYAIINANKKYGYEYDNKNEVFYNHIRAVCDGLGASADRNDDIKRVIITAN